MTFRLAAFACLALLVSCVGEPPVPCTQCDGVCVSLQTDPSNCGTCGKSCGAGQLCKAGACTATCAAPQLACSGKCVDVKNDVANCGTCGTACATTEYCAAGTCTALTACTATQTSCSGACTNTMSDQLNCGTCGNACPAGSVCSAGTCASSCAAPTTSCGDAGTACANLASDNSNCGMCGRVCAVGTTCAGGNCGCAAPATQCVGDAGTSCANLTQDNSNCGACGVVCDELSKCIAGACVDPFAVPRLCSQFPSDAGIPNDGGFVRKTVFAFGRSDLPIPVRCGVDGGTWLELPNDGGTNFSRRIGGSLTDGGEVVSRYAAVRIDYRFPNELLVSNNDERTFAVSTGSHLQYNSGSAPVYLVTSEPWGVASGCVGGFNPAGTSNINLVGLPLSVVRTNWAVGGFNAVGGPTFSSFNQVVNIVGGGFCGDVYPSEGVVRFAPCPAPGPEVCDKKDNNCDGVVDNFTDGGVCP